MKRFLEKQRFCNKCGSRHIIRLNGTTCYFDIKSKHGNMYKYLKFIKVNEAFIFIMKSVVYKPTQHHSAFRNVLSNSYVCIDCDNKMCNISVRKRLALRKRS